MASAMGFANGYAWCVQSAVAWRHQGIAVARGVSRCTMSAILKVRGCVLREAHDGLSALRCGG
jgi:hypothetical protein